MPPLLAASRAVFALDCYCNGHAKSWQHLSGVIGSGRQFPDATSIRDALERKKPNMAIRIPGEDGIGRNVSLHVDEGTRSRATRMRPKTGSRGPIIEPKLNGKHTRTRRAMATKTQRRILAGCQRWRINRRHVIRWARLRRKNVKDGEANNRPWGDDPKCDSAYRTAIPHFEPAAAHL